MCVDDPLKTLRAPFLFFLSFFSRYNHFYHKAERQWTQERGTKRDRTKKKKKEKLKIGVRTLCLLGEANKTRKKKTSSIENEEYKFLLNELQKQTKKNYFLLFFFFCCFLFLLMLLVSPKATLCYVASLLFFDQISFKHDMRVLCCTRFHLYNSLLSLLILSSTRYTQQQQYIYIYIYVYICLFIYIPSSHFRISTNVK